MIWKKSNVIFGKKECFILFCSYERALQQQTSSNCILHGFLLYKKTRNSECVFCGCNGNFEFLRSSSSTGACSYRLRSADIIFRHSLDRTWDILCWFVTTRRQELPLRRVNSHGLYFIKQRDINFITMTFFIIHAS